MKAAGVPAGWRVGRPDVPVGYGLASPDSGRFISWEDVSLQLKQARNYWVSTANPRGRPHAAPVWGVWVEDRFIFSTDRASQKAVNLRRNSQIVVHLESGDEVVIVEGTAEALEDMRRLAPLESLYRKKYGSSLGQGSVYVVAPARILAWSEADYPSSATKWERSGAVRAN
jgi:nitroimidazol reductase NimA-like FMN-containing flavoprotein (pyridoxamine 5'-phosphate oxidase superfamily)